MKESPTEGEMKTFWQDTWSEKKSHNDCALWIKGISRDNKGIPCQKWNNIEESEVAETLKKSHKLRSTGVVKVEEKGVFWEEYVWDFSNELKKKRQSWWKK